MADVLRVQNFGSHPKLVDSLVEPFKDSLKVPKEFLVRDPKNIPNRCWGDDDECKANFEFPMVELAPLMRFFDGKPEPGDEEASKKIIEDIGMGCERWGFFKVVDHGIPLELMDQVMNVSNEFFQLPVEEREKCAVRPGEFEGYGRLDLPINGPGGPQPRTWNDALRHDMRPVPSKDRMPSKPEAYRPVMEEYTQGLERIFLCVWKALSLYLGLGPDTLRKAQERDDDDSKLIVRVNHYPKCNEPEKVLGLGGHKDFGSMTILLQDEVGGLQVQKRGSTEWFDVSANTGAHKGALLVNIAMQLEILSNGRLHSVLHRALANKNSSRLSIVAFANPGSKCIIGPVPELLARTGQPPRYISSSYGNYVKNLIEDVKAGRSPYARHEINRN